MPAAKTLADYFHAHVGTVGVCKDKILFSPNDMRIEINAIREDGVIYAFLYQGDDILISATLECIMEALKAVPKTHKKKLSEVGTLIA